MPHGLTSHSMGPVKQYKPLQEKNPKNHDHAFFTSFLRTVGALALRGSSGTSRTFYMTRGARTDSGEVWWCSWRRPRTEHGGLCPAGGKWLFCPPRFLHYTWSAKTRAGQCFSDCSTLCSKHFIYCLCSCWTFHTHKCNLLLFAETLLNKPLSYQMLASGSC